MNSKKLAFILVNLFVALWLIIIYFRSPAPSDSILFFILFSILCLAVFDIAAVAIYTICSYISIKKNMIQIAHAETRLRQIKDNIQASLPFSFSDGTKLINIDIKKTGIVELSYLLHINLNNQSPIDLDLKFTLNKLSSEPLLVELMRKGVIFQCYTHNKENKFIKKIKIEPSDYLNILNKTPRSA